MKKLVCIFLLILTTVVALAVPARRGVTKTLKLTDGTMVTAQLVGDEHGHYWLTGDGRAYQRLTGSERYQQVDAEQVTQRARQRRQTADSCRTRRMAPRRVGSMGSYSGQRRGLIILVNFAGVSFQADNDRDLYQRIANEEGFSYGNFKGSIYDYFYAQSEGQFLLNFDVVGPVTVSRDQSYYGRNDDNGIDRYPGVMVIEALRLVDASVDFADYDWDDDGEVDQVYVVYAGKGEADGGGEDTIWPHEFTLSQEKEVYGDGDGEQTLDDVVVDTYACGPELNGKTGKVAGIGTMCHEFSHCLGYPDFYDTDYSGGQGMGDWDLMCGGSYNGDGFVPAGYTSYERWVAGWKSPTELTEDTTVAAMRALQDGGESYIIYNPGNRNEYYLLENRQRKGWDAGLPGSGLLILHVDYDAWAWAMNSVNDDPNHQRMTWIPADSQYQYIIYDEVKEYTSAGMANDPYPYEGNNSFSKTTTPVASFYNENTDGTYYMNSAVKNITQHTDGTISFDFVATDDSDPSGQPVAGDSKTFKLVTSVSDLVNGARCVIACSSKAKAAGEWNSGHYLSAVDVEVDGDLLTINDDVMVLTVVKTASGYAFRNNDGMYLVAANRNRVNFSDEKTSWTLSDGTTGVIMSYSLAGFPFGTILYSASKPRFTVYTSDPTNARIQANLYMEVQPYEMTLTDTSDNDAEIAAHKGECCNVTLSGRTLYKDGAWNTLCLPFDVTVAGSVLDGAEVRALSSASVDEASGVLTLRFTTVTALEAGQPYLVRWKEGGHLVDPVFRSVTIKSISPTTVKPGDGQVSFIGIYSPTDIYRQDRSNLYIGSSDKLIHAAGEGVSSFSLNAFRAYFNVGGTNAIHSIALDMTEPGTTDIASMPMECGAVGGATVYSLSGQRLSRPIAKGLYIRNGKKIVVR